MTPGVAVRCSAAPLGVCPLSYVSIKACPGIVGRQGEHEVSVGMEPEGIEPSGARIGSPRPHQTGPILTGTFDANATRLCRIYTLHGLESQEN
jgi:hypothetical protein